MDDPLWDHLKISIMKKSTVLIPLLVDDPLWAIKPIMKEEAINVLIPLLVDDPLWVRLFLKTYFVALRS